MKTFLKTWVIGWIAYTFLTPVLPELGFVMLILGTLCFALATE